MGDPTARILDLANVRVVQGNLPEATRLLRKALEFDPQNVGALNNLAMILSEQPGNVDEALQCIDRAIDNIGPRPDLYDTKACILIYGDRPAEAIELLTFVLRADTSDPRFKFHLAAAPNMKEMLDGSARSAHDGCASRLQESPIRAGRGSTHGGGPVLPRLRRAPAKPWAASSFWTCVGHSSVTARARACAAADRTMPTG